MSKRKLGYSSNSGIFAKRGDPWVTEKEGIKAFGRNLETENAEYDFSHRFHDTGTFGKPKQAQPRPDYRDPSPQPKADDPARRRASISRRMNIQINAFKPIEVAEASSVSFVLCKGCKLAICAARNQCFGALR